jgi:hypothetical protein
LPYCVCATPSAPIRQLATRCAARAAICDFFATSKNLGMCWSSVECRHLFWECGVVGHLLYL